MTVMSATTATAEIFLTRPVRKLLSALLASVSALLCPALIFASSARAEEYQCVPKVLLYDENEELSERRVDTNRDCSHDEFVFYLNGKPLRSQRDRDHDGRLDSWSQYDAEGRVRLRELDTKGDAKIDRWIDYKDDLPQRQRDDDNGDGKIDILTEFVDGEASRREEDRDFDGRFDRFTDYLGGKPSSLEEDRDFDGRVDLRAEFDLDGTKLLEHQDNNGDGTLNVSLYFRDGQQIRAEEDTTGDGNKDVITTYAGLLIALRTADTTGDGRYDTRIEYLLGVPRKRIFDPELDGRPELIAFLDENGNLEREEIDSKNAGYTDIIRYYHAGTKTKETEDPDGDGVPSLVTLFKHGLPSEQRADSNGDGRLDTAIFYQSGRKHHQEEDRNGDGEIDVRYRFDSEENVAREELDAEPDGFFESTSIFRAGVLVTRSLDAHQRGQPNQIEHYAAGVLAHIESDENLDGDVDSWSVYDQDGALTHQRQDRDHDQRVDVWIVFHPNSKHPLTASTDSNGDGTPDTVRHHDELGTLLRVERDRNADDATDDRVFYEGNYEDEIAVRYERDDDYDRRFESRGQLDSAGRVILDERDTTGDGLYDLRQHFTAGSKQKEERDTRADGHFDIVTLFEAGLPVRQDMDTTGDLKLDSTLYFADGNQTRQERDSNGDGAADLWIELDSDGLASRESFDTNFDGNIDVVRHQTKGVIQREENDRDFDGVFELESRYVAGIIVETVVHDGDLSAAWSVKIVYENGRKSEQLEDRNRDGQGDLRTHFAEDGATITRTSDDANYDGRFETTRFLEMGNVVRSETDADGDGTVELTAFFKDGRANLVEMRSAGRDCVDIRRWLNRNGDVTAEEKDSDRDCRYDTWNYYKKGRLFRQGRDTEGRGQAHLLYEFDTQGRIVIQEIASTLQKTKSRKPNKKVYYADSGDVTRQCTDQDGDGLFELQLSFAGGVVSHALLDSQNDGQADRREIYRDGKLWRVEADTNSDGRPDVVQEYEGRSVVQQDEDTDFDGRIDVRFRNGKPVELNDSVEAPGKLPHMDCGEFSSFWD